MAKNKNKKRKFNGGYGRGQNPMAEVLRLNNMLAKIDVNKNVDEAIKKVNQVNNKIVENNTVQVANQLLENRTIIKDFTEGDYSISRYVEKDKVQVVDKPLVVGYLRDYSGCGHFRMVYPMNMINTKFAYSGKINCTLFPVTLTQEDILPHVRSFVFQRPIGDDQTFKIRAYKKFQEQYQYKLIGELDDYVFDLPEYHPGYENNIIRNVRSLLVNLRLMDEIIVSTNNLKKELIELGIDTKITVIENTLPKYLYQTDVKRFKFSDIIKPKIAFTGSNFHYNNSKQLDGDFSGAIKEFIIKNVDNFEFVFFGDAPYFLKKEVNEGKIIIVPYTNTVEYSTNLKKYRIDFVIAPLVENLFNSCKSDLRYLEASAMGSVFIGYKFLNGLSSPYQTNRLTLDENSTVEDIENIIKKYSTKDLFNDEISSQYNELDDRWLENTANLLKYIEVYSSGIKGLIIEQDHPQYEEFKPFIR